MDSDVPKMNNIYNPNLCNLRFVIALLLILLPCCSRGDAPEIEGMIFVPLGEFTMGSNEIDSNGLAKEFGARKKVFFEDEGPVRKIVLKGFYIDKYEVTNKDYKKFCAMTGYPPPPVWEEGMYIKGQDMHPVENVSWFDMNKYCEWLGKKLPTEEEWEKAARGPLGNKYPWGNEFDISKANLNKGDTLPVGSMPEDKSYYGLYDMAGNVMEWTDSWYGPYAGSILESKDFGKKYRILRGGAGTSVGHYNLSKNYSRSSFRHYYLPGGKGNDGGGRCVRSP